MSGPALRGSYASRSITFAPRPFERERYVRQAYELDLQAEPTLKAKQSLLFCRLNCQGLQGEQLCLEERAMGSALSNRYDRLDDFCLMRRERSGFRSIR